MKPRKHDYYQVTLPGDYRETEASLRQAAIDTVKARVRLVITLCEWTAWPIKGQFGDDAVTYRVRRERNKGSIYV